MRSSRTSSSSSSASSSQHHFGAGIIPHAPSTSHHLQPQASSSKIRHSSVNGALKKESATRALEHIDVALPLSSISTNRARKGAAASSANPRLAAARDAAADWINFNTTSGSVVAASLSSSSSSSSFFPSSAGVEQRAASDQKNKSTTTPTATPTGAMGASHHLISALRASLVFARQGHFATALAHCNEAREAVNKMKKLMMMKKNNKATARMALNRTNQLPTASASAPDDDDHHHNDDVLENGSVRSAEYAVALSSAMFCVGLFPPDFDAARRCIVDCFQLSSNEADIGHAEYNLHVVEKLSREWQEQQHNDEKKTNDVESSAQKQTAATWFCSNAEAAELLVEMFFTVMPADLALQEEKEEEEGHVAAGNHSTGGRRQETDDEEWPRAPDPSPARTEEVGKVQEQLQQPSSTSAGKVAPPSPGRSTGRTAASRSSSAHRFPPPNPPARVLCSNNTIGSTTTKQQRPTSAAASDSAAVAAAPPMMVATISHLPFVTFYDSNTASSDTQHQQQLVTVKEMITLGKTTTKPPASSAPPSAAAAATHDDAEVWRRRVGCCPACVVKSLLVAVLSMQRLGLAFPPTFPLGLDTVMLVRRSNLAALLDENDATAATTSSAASSCCCDIPFHDVVRFPRECCTNSNSSSSVLTYNNDAPSPLQLQKMRADARNLALVVTVLLDTPCFLTLRDRVIGALHQAVTNKELPLPYSILRCVALPKNDDDAPRNSNNTTNNSGSSLMSSVSASSGMVRQQPVANKDERRNVVTSKSASPLSAAASAAQSTVGVFSVSFDDALSLFVNAASVSALREHGTLSARINRTCLLCDTMQFTESLLREMRNQQPEYYNNRNSDESLPLIPTSLFLRPLAVSFVGESGVDAAAGGLTADLLQRFVDQFLAVWNSSEFREGTSSAGNSGNDDDAESYVSTRARAFAVVAAKCVIERRRVCLGNRRSTAKWLCRALICGPDEQSWLCSRSGTSLNDNSNNMEGVVNFLQLPDEKGKNARDDAARKNRSEKRQQQTDDSDLLQLEMDPPVPGSGWVITISTRPSQERCDDDDDDDVKEKDGDEDEESLLTRAQHVLALRRGELQQMQRAFSDVIRTTLPAPLSRKLVDDGSENRDGAVELLMSLITSSSSSSYSDDNAASVDISGKDVVQCLEFRGWSSHRNSSSSSAGSSSAALDDSTPYYLCCWLHYRADSDMRRKFLRFITCVPDVPRLSAHESLLSHYDPSQQQQQQQRIVIQRDTERLLARTCLRTLHLPSYSTMQDLAEALETALMVMDLDAALSD